MEAAIRGHGAARCAIDIALHDLVGKVAGVPVHELLGLPADIPPTDFTIGIDEPAIVAERAARAAGFPALKIKVRRTRGPRDARGGPRASSAARSGSTPTPAGSPTRRSASSPSSNGSASS